MKHIQCAILLQNTTCLKIFLLRSIAPTPPSKANSNSATGNFLSCFYETSHWAPSPATPHFVLILSARVGPK
jgi:hypothetical protein